MPKTRRNRDNTPKPPKTKKKKKGKGSKGSKQTSYRNTRAGTQEAQDRSEELAHEGDVGRAEHLANIFDSGKKTNKSFFDVLEWLTSGGGDNIELRREYVEYWQSKGQDRQLMTDIQTLFGASELVSYEGSAKSNYLIDVMLNGEPSPVSQIALAMGKVTGAGGDSKMVTQILLDMKEPKVAKAIYVKWIQWSTKIEQEDDLRMVKWIRMGLSGEERDAKKAELEEAQGNGGDTAELEAQLTDLDTEVLQKEQEFLYSIIIKYAADFGGLDNRAKCLDELEKYSARLPLKTRMAAAMPGSWFHNRVKDRMDSKSYTGLVISAIGGGERLPEEFFADDLKDKDGDEKDEALQALSNDVNHVRAYINKKVKKGHKDPKNLEKVLYKLSREQWMGLMYTYLASPEQATMLAGDVSVRAQFAAQGAAAFIEHLKPIAEKIKPNQYVAYFTRDDAGAGMMVKDNGYNSLKAAMADGEPAILKALTKLGSGEYAWVRNDPELMGKLVTKVKSSSGRKQAAVLLGIHSGLFAEADQVREAKSGELKLARKAMKLGRLKKGKQKDKDKDESKQVMKDFFASRVGVGLDDGKSQEAQGNQKLHSERSTEIQDKARNRAEFKARHWGVKLSILLNEREVNSVKFYTMLTEAFYAGNRRRASPRHKETPEMWAEAVAAHIDGAAMAKIERHSKYKLGFDEFLSGQHVSVDQRLEQSKLMGVKRGHGNKNRKGDVMASFEDLSGFELLREWSDYERLRSLKTRQTALKGRIDQFGADSRQGQTCVTALREVNASIRVYTPRLRSDRQAFLDENFNTSARSEIVESLNNKFIDAFESDPAFQLALQFQGAQIDTLAVEDMKAVNQLGTRQRMVDTGAKWRRFSSKSDQMREARSVMVGRTRNARNMMDLQGEEQEYQESRELANQEAPRIESARKDLGSKTERFQKFKSNCNAWVVRIIGIATAVLAAAISAATLGGATPFAAAMWGAVISGCAGILGATATRIIKPQLEGDAYEDAEAWSDFAKSIGITAVTSLLSMGAAGLQNLAGVLPTVTEPAKSLFTAQGAQEFFAKAAITGGKQLIGGLIKVGADHITSEDRFSGSALGGDIFQTLSTTALSWLLTNGLGYAQGAAGQTIDDQIFDPNSDVSDDGTVKEMFNPNSDANNQVDINSTNPLDQHRVQNLQMAGYANKGQKLVAIGGGVGIGLGMGALKDEIFGLQRTNPKKAKSKTREALVLAQQLYEQASTLEEIEELKAICDPLFASDPRMKQRAKRAYKAAKERVQAQVAQI